MHDLILGGPGTSLGVTPTVLREKLLGAIGFDRLRKHSGRHLQSVPSAPLFPLITDGALLPILLPVVTERHGGVVLAVHRVGYQTQCESRDKFADKHHA